VLFCFNIAARSVGCALIAEASSLRQARWERLD
jgi:hypothetical protein